MITPHDHHLADEKAKPSYEETEPHHCDAGSDPRKQRAFRCEEDTRVIDSDRFRRQDSLVILGLGHLHSSVLMRQAHSKL